MPLDEYQELLQELHGSQLVYLEDFARADGDEPFLDRISAGRPREPARALQDAQLARGADRGDRARCPSASSY